MTFEAFSMDNIISEWGETVACLEELTNLEALFWRIQIFMLMFLFPKHIMPVFKIQNPSAIFIGKKIIFDHLHQVSYSYHNPRRCLLCCTCHLYTMR
jgi:hypothetical protein